MDGNYISTNLLGASTPPLGLHTLNQQWKGWGRHLQSDSLSTTGTGAPLMDILNCYSTSTEKLSLPPPQMDLHLHIT